MKLSVTVDDIVTETEKNKQEKKKKKKDKSLKKEKKAKKERNGQLAESNDQTEDIQTPSETSNVQANGHTEKELTPEQKDGALSKFDISEDTMKKLTDRGVTYLFPIQAKTYHMIYEGKNVVAQARTGTGKTLSFALPLVEKLQKENIKKTTRAPKVRQLFV